MKMQFNKNAEMLTFLKPPMFRAAHCAGSATVEAAATAARFA